MSRKRAVAKLLDVETWDAMKAMGYTDDELHKEQPCGPVIFSYTRKQAIEDGVLVDLMQPGTATLVRQAGVRLHTAMTTAAYISAIGPILEPDEPDHAGKLPLGQSIKGRLWDMLSVFRAAALAQIRRGVESSQVHFAVSVDDGGDKHRSVAMYCQCGASDDGESGVLTIMLEGED